MTSEAVRRHARIVLLKLRLSGHDVSASRGVRPLSRDWAKRAGQY
jgi:hypothetical protein